MHGLETLAQLRANETLLVHSGTGGVGLAAIQIARHLGAKVIATAGSEEKRRYLRDVGIEHVFDSHSPDFAQQTLEATAGRGVDVVLNALAGDLIAAGFRALAQGGRFIELGKRDIWTPEQVAAQRSDVSYFAFDFGTWANQNPAATQKLFQQLASRFNARHYEPLPVRTFDDPQTAFRTMAQTNHVGKLVVVESSEAWMTQLLPNPAAQYLITGGLGAIGLLTAEWLASKGARHIVLVGRSQPSQAAAETIQSLRDRGVNVSIRPLNISDPTQVEALLSELRASDQPLRGVFHAAGILDDGVVKDQSWDRVEQVLAPKIEGAENLHRAAQQDQLDYFVLYSSASAVIGSPGQTAYAAGNAYMDGLAHSRREQGLPAISVNWGPWASSGMAARLSDQQQRRLSQSGSLPIQSRDAFDALEAALSDLPPQTVVLDIDWTKLSSNSPFYAELVQPAAQSGTVASGKTAELRGRLSQATALQREEILVDYVTNALSAVCGFPPSDIKPFQSVTEFGIDSLAALELRNRIQADLGLAIAVSSLLGGNSVTEVAATLAETFATSEDGQSLNTSAAPVGTAVEYPLTYGQQGLWFLQKMAADTSAYNLPVCLRVSPCFNASILQRALSQLADRHETLRTVFVEDLGQPRQRTVADAPIDFRVVEAPGTVTPEILLAEMRRPLPLDKPLFRATLFREPHADTLLLSIHHLVGDGWSLVQLADELFRLYEAQLTGSESPLAPISARYQDFVASQKALLTSSEGETMWAYWREHFETLPQTLRIPGTQPHSNMLQVRGDVARATWSAADLARLHSFAQDRNTTLYVVVLSALRMLLYRVTGQDDLAIGTPVSGRTRTEWQQVVGYFVNMLPIRLRFQPEDSFDRLVEGSRAVVVSALANQDFPFQAIVERLKIARDTTRTPILQVVLNVLQFRRQATNANTAAPGERKVEAIAIPNMAGQFELSLEIQELPTGATLDLKYDADLISREMAERMLSGLTEILRAALDHSDLPALELLARSAELSEPEQIEL
jgi:NADPH:quinone reductase-like Zn-dependent oxidoreductase/acyl carrier protein